MSSSGARLSEAVVTAAIQAGLPDNLAVVLTPQASGAVADGTTDDTAAMQAALDAAVAANRRLRIRGRFRITAPIVLPNGVPVVIEADRTDVNAFGSLSESVASIESSSTAVFVAANPASPVQLHLSGVNFRNTDGGITTALFDDVRLSRSRITEITAAHYHRIFKDGRIDGVSRVDSSQFLSVRAVFCSSDVVDSTFDHNYINGRLDANATAFTGGWAHSTFAFNYVDFLKRCFDLPAGDQSAIKVIGNTFDYIWCTLGSSTGAHVFSTVVVGNTWTHCTATEALPHFTAEDADMTGTPWRAIDAGTGGLSRMTITGNHFLSVDQAIRLRGLVRDVCESGNIFDSTDPTARVDFITDWTGAGLPGVHLESHATQRVAQTFAAGMTLDGKHGAIWLLTLTGNLTSLAPPNPWGDGMVCELHLIQDGTGSRTLSGASAKFKWAGGTAPTLTTAAGKRDIFRFRYVMANDFWYELGRAMNV